MLRENEKASFYFIFLRFSLTNKEKLTFQIIWFDSSIKTALKFVQSDPLAEKQSKRSRVNQTYNALSPPPQH